MQFAYHTNPRYERPCQGRHTAAIRDASHAEVLLEVEKGTNNKSPLIIVFTSSNCGPCKIVHKTLVKIDMTMPLARILLIDIDSEEEFASKCGITQIPTLMFIGTDEDPSKPCLITQGLVSVPLLMDVINSKLQYAGKNLSSHRRL